MMTFTQNPVNFDTSFQIDDTTFFTAAHLPNHFIYLPTVLEVASQSDRSGKLDFSVEAVRGESPFLPPEPYDYGLLDVRVQPLPLSDALVTKLHLRYPRAVFVTPITFQRGYIRLLLVRGQQQLTADEIKQLEMPVPLVLNNLCSARLVRRLSSPLTLVLKDVLQHKSLTFAAVAETTILGQTPAIAAQVSFEQYELWSALAALTDTQGRLTHRAIVNFWMQDRKQLPLVSTQGFSIDDRVQLAHTLADWTTSHFACTIAASAAPLEPTWLLGAIPPIDMAITWDLSQRQIVSRVLLLWFNPFDAAQQVVARFGLGAVWQETVVPSLVTSFQSLSSVERMLNAD